VITHRILLVFACGADEYRLELDREERAIRGCLRRCRSWQQFELSTCPAATINDFRRGLLDWPGEDDGTQRIVHFAGHGSARGFCFVDENNVTYETNPRALCDQLQLHGVSVVIFAACHSAEAYRDLTFPYCISMAGSVLDPLAMEFSRGFYDAIAAGRTVPKAFDEGVNNVHLHRGSLEVTLYERGVVSRQASADGGLSSAHGEPSKAGVPRAKPIPPALKSRLDSAVSLLHSGQLDAAARQAREALGIDPSLGRANLIHAAITLAREEAFTLPGARAREVEAQLNVALADVHTRACARVLLAAFKYEYYARNHWSETEPRLEDLFRAAEAEGGLTKSDAELAARMRLPALTRHRLGRLFEAR
jgi:hypothetical protein